MRFIVEPISPGERQLTQRVRRTRHRKRLNLAGLLFWLGVALLMGLANNLGTLVAGSEWMP